MEIKYGKFQHTATRRWLLPQAIFRFLCLYVSTHSHPKVAAFQKCGLPRKCRGFNTQPPEGGCRFAPYVRQPFYDVSTHSHPKVAANLWAVNSQWINGFNTQPPEGGCSCEALLRNQSIFVSTHSHPKVAANGYSLLHISLCVSTHSHPKVAAF